MRERQIVISEDVLDYLADLSYVLFKKGYFNFLENALEYVDNIYDEIFETIFISKHIKVPKKQRPFGDFYFLIKTNKRTAWHIYFIEKNNVFYITKISNNHLPTARFLNNG